MGCWRPLQTQGIWNSQPGVQPLLVDSFVCSWMGSISKAFVNTGVFLGFILGPIDFLLYINDLLHIICNMTLCASDTTLYSKCDQVSDLDRHFELTSELECGVRH